MSVRSIAVRKLLAEARGALTFGRAHVVVIADREIARQLPEMLAMKLRGEMDAVTVRLVGQHDGVADCVARAIRDARLAALQGELSDAATPPVSAPQRAPLVLLLPDALAIPPASLRSLHEITSRLGAHRLVLLVDRDATTVEDPALELGARLGAGVSKIELDLEPDAAPAPPVATVSAPEPPPAVATIFASERPAGTRAHAPASRMDLRIPPPVPRRRRRGLRALATALLAAAALLATPGIVEHGLRRHATPGDSPTAALSPPEAGEELSARAEEPPAPGEKPSAPAEQASAPAEEPSAPDPKPPVAKASADERPGPPDAEARTAAAQASARVRRDPAPAPPRPAPRPAPAPVWVGVNLNAVPWAELEIDGRKVGPTPIANLRLAAGEHEVRATFPDGRVSRERIRVDARRRHFQIR